jgi:branched-subunit amino acid transport protein
MEFSTDAIWTMIVAVSVATYVLRAGFLFAVGYVDAFPPTVERMLEFFPVAVLSALIAPGLLLFEGTMVPGLGNPRLVAGLVAFAVAWYTESLLATVGVGMVVFWTLLFVV